MKNKYIDYEEYLRTRKHINNLESFGFEFIRKKNKIKLVLGFVCLGVAIFPNGLGFIFYPLGFILLGSAGIDFYLLRCNLIRKIRRKFV